MNLLYMRMHFFVLLIDPKRSIVIMIENYYFSWLSSIPKPREKFSNFLVAIAKSSGVPVKYQ